MEEVEEDEEAEAMVVEAEATVAAEEAMVAVEAEVTMPAAGAEVIAAEAEAGTVEEAKAAEALVVTAGKLSQCLNNVSPFRAFPSINNSSDIVHRPCDCTLGGTGIGRSIKIIRRTPGEA